MKRLALLLALSLLAAPAFAWGPRAESSIVTSAAQLLGKEGLLQIQRIQEDLRRGSLAPQSDLEKIMPGVAANPVAAIENEMAVLQAVKQGQIDGYYAYRLGALGKVVASVTAPLTQAEPAIANLYYADVENNIERAALVPSAPRKVEPAAYFERRILEANQNSDMIVADYRAGTGFNGVAKNLLQADAGRSVSAVADVWRTILQSGAASISTAQEEAYVLDAYRYYIGRKNRGEIEAADRRLSEMMDPSADTVIRIGDLFYEAGMREEAVQRYEMALAQAPQRRDVAQRIGEYYMQLGREAMDQKRLEDALKSFEQALSADPLQPQAEAARLDAAAQIADRDARLKASQEALESAGGFQNLAEQEALDNHIAEAVALLNQARVEYQRVDEEFALEYQHAMQGLRDIDTRLDTLRTSLFANAALLGGSGFSLDAAARAKEEGQTFDRRAFESMVRDALQTTKENLEAQSQQLLEIH